jgi:capsule polysaccharide export protein KpsE/RkpR
VRVLDSLTHGDSTLAPYRVEKLMRDMVTTAVERKTGLISVGVTHSDSALARLIGTRIVDGASAVVVSTAKAQAALQRVGQERRVEDAAAQVRARQQDYIDFLRSNRTVAPYSAAALERDRLQRASEVAQNSYSQAVADRESARGRELEETPAVVIVDSLPKQLAPMPRRASLFAVAAALLVFVGMTAFFTMRELWASLRAADDPVLEGLFGPRRHPAARAGGDGRMAS